MPNANLRELFGMWKLHNPWAPWMILLSARVDYMGSGHSWRRSWLVWLAKTLRSTMELNISHYKGAISNTCNAMVFHQVMVSLVTSADARSIWLVTCIGLPVCFATNGYLTAMDWWMVQHIFWNDQERKHLSLRLIRSITCSALPQEDKQDKPESPSSSPD